MGFKTIKGLWAKFIESDQKLLLVVEATKRVLWKRAVRECQLQYSPSSVFHPGRRVAWIISYTAVAREPRVRRQAAAMIEAGWRVVVFGLGSEAEAPKQWYFAALPPRTPYPFIIAIVTRLTRAIGIGLARWGLGASMRTVGARLHYWSQPSLRWRQELIIDFLKGNPHLEPKLVISHDYFTCPAGAAVAKLSNAKFAVDCHEYARGQYMHDPRWVKNVRPAVMRLQDYYLSRADVVTTVSDGIANLLNAEQDLKSAVQVIKSVPFRNIQKFRPTGERIRVLYHGDLHYIRGLHKAIKSLPLWREEFDLVLRGSGDTNYVRSLQELTKTLGLTHRVFFREPVPFEDIIPEANAADIGYFVHKDLSPQKRYVLPNKFFEYVMAGLALCVSDLPEMAVHVRQYGLGRLVSDFDEGAIASAINSFDRASIDGYKRKSIAAAAELNWEVESKKMLSLYEGLMQ